MRESYNVQNFGILILFVLIIDCLVVCRIILIGPAYDLTVFILKEKETHYHVRKQISVESH